jgi:hypothetical protein
MGRLRGPGGSGGCERLSQYFRHQHKPVSTKAIVARYNPVAGSASSIIRNVEQSALHERGMGEMLYLYRVCGVRWTNRFDPECERPTYYWSDEIRAQRLVSFTPFYRSRSVSQWSVLLAIGNSPIRHAGLGGRTRRYRALGNASKDGPRRLYKWIINPRQRYSWNNISLCGGMGGKGGKRVPPSFLWNYAWNLSWNDA